ncbi:killer toxin subunits alpha/beta [Colletotrichum spaethianum]|uniref:chitinase n=1 Tax=Colletotrichum spaethianum TaxID=700344 RepID=A0AA37PEZ6_9PEZI|nr:killer toxin subunits alpha/beta [Colletotrichum spaethianum]GKT51071.1 killer toxin subunits alpha/beta [Colletotrichum spaethianum]
MARPPAKSGGSRAWSWILLPLLAAVVILGLLNKNQRHSLSSQSSTSSNGLLTHRHQLDADLLPVRTHNGPSPSLGNVSHLHAFQKRDDYTCTKEKPCKNGACCGSFFGGDQGVCGYGETFCGSDCVSNCDAHAECGQYAQPAGKECPLKVCCSKFGFCGSTEEYCTGGCESNCVVNPPIPAGGSAIPVLENKVIGYYEAWSARRSCHSFPPAGLPVEGLTHVNFAFAYIDPDSLEITTMDSETDAGLFAQVTDIKNSNALGSDLQVFVAIGGWTFSDNDTATQPVFPDIAASEEKSKKFANNLVKFMTRYGFDGVDLDWEYPGAPDRGGNEEDDRQGYVSMLKILRETFLASARGNYGLTFTIPTSYWYLRWFDVPGLLEYADWINMMSYDLHGVWDEHNPIGNIVQAHTNLTEIKLAADLLWRNNVEPGKVVLGVGFYGRSFQLKDTSCKTPGCAFSGAADKGPCTNSAGTLGYFEIMDIIADQDPEVVHDKEAAAKYIVFGDKKDQWVSFDDADTLQAKVEWADSVGLGGVMIWAVDLDDNDFSALSGLTGQSLASFELNLKRTATAETAHWSTVNGQQCIISDCLEKPDVPAGYAIAPNGKFRDKCWWSSPVTGNVPLHKYIYCPVNAMPQSCEWRGSGSCHGQCHEGEVTVTHSPHGSESCLAPGQQAFCCKSNTWSALVDKCDWATKCEECPSDAPHEVSSRSVYKSFLSSCTQRFCCPYAFENCHWIGKGTCDDNECSATDVEVGLDPSGDTGSLCASGFNSRQKVLCCNSPSDLNPFLPASLEDLFPTLPPVEGYMPAFDQDILSYNSTPGPQAFFSVVVDGPKGTVSNVDKRDGSHLEFLTRGNDTELEAGQTHVTHLVCMEDNPAISNCDDMHEGGLEGTILKMPAGLGFAKYVVAHSLHETNYSLPGHVVKRAPQGARIWELAYSYDFSRVKKRDDGDVYFRVDYASTNKYYTDIVQAKHQRRDLQPRFWSKISSVWKTIMDNIRGKDSDDNGKTGSTSISKNDFSVLIVGDDGSDKGCDGSGFLKLTLAGSMRNEMDFGFTLVGTIQPYKLEEAFGYFDSDMFMSAQLDFDGRGELDVSTGASKKLFASPITGYEASQPGFVSFKPQLNAEVSLVGKGEIDAKFSVSFESGTSSTAKTNAPPGLGTFGGGILTNIVNNAADGAVSVGSSSSSSSKRAATSDSVFALNVILEAVMELKVFGYSTPLQEAGANFQALVPHAIRIDANSGDVIDAHQGGLLGVLQTGSLIQDGWEDGTSHTFGSVPSPRVVLTGGDTPEDRDAPEINGYALFGANQFMNCGSGGGNNTGELVCFYDLVAYDDELVQPDPPYKLKREYLEPLSEQELQRLEPRAGPSDGNAQNYPAYEYPANPNGPTNAVNFRTPTYPNGDDGDALDDETGRNERWARANPGNCVDTSVTQNGVQGVHWTHVQSEHPDDRSITPNHFLNFVQSGTLDLADGNGGTFTTQLPLFTWNEVYNNFFHDYRTWVPATVNVPIPAGSGADDMADALGSTGNPTVMYNLEENLNVIKGRIYTTEGNPISDDRMRTLMQNPTQQSAETVLSVLASTIAVFNVMNSAQVSGLRTQVNDGRAAAAGQFDTMFAATFPNNPARMRPLLAEFITQWNIRATNFARRAVDVRLNELQNAYGPLAANPANPARQAMALNVLNQVATLRALATGQITL